MIKRPPYSSAHRRHRARMFALLGAAGGRGGGGVSLPADPLWHLRHEELPGSNLLLYSSDVTQAPWITLSTSVVGGIDDPFGGNDAFRITNDSATSIELALSIDDNTQNVRQLFPKSGVTSWTRISHSIVTDAAASRMRVIFEAAGSNAQWLYSNAATTLKGTAIVFSAWVRSVDSDNGVLDIYGPQLEIGTTPSSYNPTNAQSNGVIQLWPANAGPDGVRSGASTSPVVIANSRDGNPGAAFTGLSYMNLESPVVDLGEFDLWLAFDREAGGAAHYLLGGGTTLDYLLLSINEPAEFNWRAETAIDNNIISTSEVEVYDPRLYRVTRDATGDFKVYESGATGMVDITASPATDPALWDIALLGVRSNVSGHFIGTLWEVVLYDKALSDGDADTIWEYFNERFPSLAITIP